MSEYCMNFIIYFFWLQLQYQSPETFCVKVLLLGGFFSTLIAVSLLLLLMSFCLFWLQIVFCCWVLLQIKYDFLNKIFILNSIQINVMMLPFVYEQNILILRNSVTVESNIYNTFLFYLLFLFS